MAPSAASPAPSAVGPTDRQPHSAAGQDGGVHAVPEAVLSALRDATSVIVCGHVNPDGDALGSIFALTAALQALGVSAQATWGGVDESTPPAPLEPSLSFLTRDLPATAPADLVPGADLIVCCDTAAPSRLGTLEPLLHTARRVMVIDHHAVGQPFGDIRYVQPQASSTGALVLLVIRALGVELTPAIADALYLAIMTDTGRFSYSSTTPEDHRAAAELITAGADHTGIAQAVYASASPGYIGLVGRVTGRAVVDPLLTWSYTTQEDLSATGAAEAENDGLIELLRSVRDVRATLFLREREDGQWRCSLRSAGGADVARVAAEFGGGGHIRAAGFTAEGDPHDIAATVRAALAAADGTAT